MGGNHGEEEKNTNRCNNSPDEEVISASASSTFISTISLSLSTFYFGINSFFRPGVAHFIHFKHILNSKFKTCYSLSSKWFASPPPLSSLVSSSTISLHLVSSSPGLQLTSDSTVAFTAFAQVTPNNAGAKNVGQGNGQQFITGGCTSDAVSGSPISTPRVAI